MRNPRPLDCPALMLTVAIHTLSGLPELPTLLKSGLLRCQRASLCHPCPFHLRLEPERPGPGSMPQDAVCHASRQRRQPGGRSAMAAAHSGVAAGEAQQVAGCGLEARGGAGGVQHRGPGADGQHYPSADRMARHSARGGSWRPEQCSRCRPVQSRHTPLPRVLDLSTP